MSITPTIELLAAPRVSAARVIASIKASEHGAYDDAVLDLLVNDYFIVCQRVGLDPLLALAQMIYETNNLTGGWVAPPHANLANLGVTGEPEVGLSFASWARSTRVHVGLLLAYALTDEQANAEQWALIATAMHVVPIPAAQRGRAKTLYDLSGIWRDDTEYAEKVAQVANTILELEHENGSGIVVERGMYEKGIIQTDPSVSVLTDPLTGLFTRVYMEVSLEREIHQALRQGGEIGVIIINLDEFRDFNETVGYTAGDTILRELGKFLFHSVRRGDIACRYGGDAFVLVLPDASLENTLRRAEEIRQAVQTLEIDHKGQPLTCNTISAGVASFPKNGSTAQALLQAAAEALYQAKEDGRNRVLLA